MQMLPSKLLDTNKTYIIGVDEVGIGCISGPTYICAFKAHKDWLCEGIRDSKKLTEKQREFYYQKIDDDQSFYGYAIRSASSEEIDRKGIYNAVHDLYYDALQELGFYDSLVVVDGKRFKEERYEYEALVGGDDLVPHISAASILAKVSRDSFMKKIHSKHPEYNWSKNKGYPSPEHKKALEKFGISPFHRRSYEPIKSMIKNMG